MKQIRLICSCYRTIQTEKQEERFMFQESLEKRLPYLHIQIDSIVLIINKRIWEIL